VSSFVVIGQHSLTVQVTSQQTASALTDASKPGVCAMSCQGYFPFSLEVTQAPLTILNRKTAQQTSFRKKKTTSGYF
jgi:hypothetical protein